MFYDFPDWLRLALAIAVAMVIAFASTPIVKTFAQRVGAMDVPKDARRMHDHAIPRMGGLAIFLGFIISTLLFVPIDTPMKGVLIGSVIIVAAGAVDDIVALNAWVKLFFQVVAACVAVSQGVVIQVVTSPNLFSEAYLFLGWLSVPLTILWIVAVTNSVNLIDGLDGLACGVSAISSVTMLVVAMLVSESSIAVILAALAGACLGFIPYNLNPAKIFMGDTGSQLLGYLLATVSVMGLFKFYALFTFAVPLLALAFPLLDTTFAFVRRILHGQSPFHPDRGHLHHRLIDMGLNQKQAVAVLYAVSAVMGLVAVVAATTGATKMALLIIAVALALIVGAYIVRAYEHHEHELHDAAAKRRGGVPEDTLTFPAIKSDGEKEDGDSEKN
ncbi:MAG: undecaprenyl/decaprenyl-phosphate alpha-N-acetylglucosaminyl 1-phosphate transferase [Oscillospiraceae bacterium]|nr:undecaprenyl/decaprenyl-phosphate alpha-N-acetylglucosaminyl 1-phosphate transferase [Oscillospiraceae bacterium]